MKLERKKESDGNTNYTMKLKTLIILTLLSLVWVTWLLLTFYHYLSIVQTPFPTAASLRDISNYSKNSSSTIWLHQLKSPAGAINSLPPTRSINKKLGVGSLFPFPSSFSESSFLSRPSSPSPLGSSGGRNPYVRDHFSIKWRKIAGKWNDVRNGECPL